MQQTHLPTNQDPTPIESAFPIIAVPSTSGTGSHQTPYYVITNTSTGEKPGNGHRSIFPCLAIVDLDIVSSMPPQLTAETGFDVMAHALEGLVSANANDISDIHALTAIELVWTYLPRAYKNGDEFSGWFYLTDLFVEREYRLRGIGSGLLRALEEKLLQYQVNRIWTWTAGHEGPEFYKKQGYTVFAELEKWYSSGGSRIALRKRIEA